MHENVAHLLIFDSHGHCSDRILWPKAAHSRLLGDRQQIAERWIQSVAINRPLVGDLTPATLLFYNGSLPSHSLRQPINFSHKCDEQVLVVRLLGSGRTGKVNICCMIYDVLRGWEYGSHKKNSDIKAASHPSNICTASWRQLPVIMEICHDSKF